MLNIGIGRYLLLGGWLLPKQLGGTLSPPGKFCTLEVLRAVLVCSRMYFRLICNDLVRGYLYIYIHTYSPKAAGGLRGAISTPRKCCTLESLRAVLVCSRMYFRLICNDLVRGYLYIYIFIHIVPKQLVCSRMYFRLIYIYTYTYI
jgi:hypothetical protein